jgi:cupin 2 domain-containing protein
MNPRTMNNNLFSGIPQNLPVEFAEVLCQAGEMKVERIVSRGHASPPGFWYDQDQNEFVLLVKGRACLTLEGQVDPTVLEEGDWIDIKAHVRHRVDWTAPDQDTVWLAVYYG